MDSTQILRSNDERAQKVQLASKLVEWANFNKICLNNISNLSIGNIGKLKGLYAEWYEIWILDNAFMGELIVETRTSLSMHIFVELSRTHFILSYDRLDRERREIRELGKLPENPQQYDILCGGIMSFPQSKIMETLLEISFCIKTNQPVDKRTLDLLYLRNAGLFCDTASIHSLDLDEMREIDGEHYRPSRDYMMFTCIYFQAIYHRFFYLEEFNVERIGLSDDSATAQWIDSLMVTGDAFDRYYEEACMEAYNFPGDEAWFHYRYPSDPPYRATIISCIRPSLSKRFTSEYRISLETVRATVNHFDLQGACSRIFLMLSLDHYMWSKFQFHWMEAVCIEHEILEPSQGKLFGEHHPPYLLEVFSLYHLYYKGIVYQSENIYQVISLWIDIVKRDYNCHVFGCQLKFD